MSIRTATPADIPSLVGLMEEFYRESGFSLQPERAKAAFQRLLDDPALGRIWICEQKKDAVGYIVLTLGFSMEYGGRDAFVDDLFLRPGFRGSGLGRQLLGTLISECGRIGVRALHLEVGRANQRAQSLYRAHGFQDNDRQLLSLKLGPVAHEPKKHRE